MDPSSNDPNPPGVFGGVSWEWRSENAIREVQALVAVREFVERYGRVPTQKSWAAAHMTPREKTVRNRFGSVRAALATARAMSRTRLGMLGRISRTSDRKSLPCDQECRSDGLVRGIVWL